MQFNGTVTINAPLQRVWEYLIDPPGISQCVPGLEELEIIVPDKEFRVRAAVGLGNIRAVFNTDVEFLELSAPTYAKMKAHGTASGSAADVMSEMTLKKGDENGTTELEWSADIVIIGKIAATAARLMPSVTKKLTGTFFNCVKGKIEVLE